MKIEPLSENVSFLVEGDADDYEGANASFLVECDPEDYEEASFDDAFYDMEQLPIVQ